MEENTGENSPQEDKNEQRRPENVDQPPMNLPAPNAKSRAADKYGYTVLSRIPLGVRTRLGLLTSSDEEGDEDNEDDKHGKINRTQEHQNEQQQQQQDFQQETAPLSPGSHSAMERSSKRIIDLTFSSDEEVNKEATDIPEQVSEALKSYFTTAVLLKAIDDDLAKKQEKSMKDLEHEIRILKGILIFELWYECDPCSDEIGLNRFRNWVKLDRGALARNLKDVIEGLRKKYEKRLMKMDFDKESCENKAFELGNRIWSCS